MDDLKNIKKESQGAIRTSFEWVSCLLPQAKQETQVYKWEDKQNWVH